MNESDMAKRIAELEEELARTKQHRDMLQRTVRAYVPIPPEWEKPLTPEEISEMLNTPPGGESIGDIVREIKNRAR